MSVTFTAAGSAAGADVQSLLVGCVGVKGDHPRPTVTGDLWRPAVAAADDLRGHGAPGRVVPLEDCLCGPAPAGSHAGRPAGLVTQEYLQKTAGASTGAALLFDVLHFIGSSSCTKYRWFSKITKYNGIWVWAFITSKNILEGKHNQKPEYKQPHFYI